MHRIMRWFGFAQLPPELQEVSKPFSQVAEFVAGLPENDQRRMALEHLLIAKDAAVRCKIAGADNA